LSTPWLRGQGPRGEILASGLISERHKTESNPDSRVTQLEHSELMEYVAGSLELWGRIAELNKIYGDVEIFQVSTEAGLI